MRQSTYITANSGTECRKSTYRKSNLLCRITMLVALLLTFALGAKAQDYYVFRNSNGYYIYNNNGSVGATNTFSPACVWIASDALESNTSRSLQSFVNNTQYLSASKDDVTISNSSQERWRIGNSFLYNYYGGLMGFIGGYTSYINHNGNKFSTSTSSNSTNGFKAIAITVNKTASTESHTYSTPEISITPSTGNISYPGSQSYEASATSIIRTTTGRIGYTTFRVDGTSYIYDDNNNKLNSIPSSTTTQKQYEVQSYTWQVSGNASNYISGSSTTSSITYTTTSEPADDVQGTITVKANYANTNELTSVNIPSATATINITLVKADPISIKANDLTLAVDEQKSISYTLQPSNANRVIAYSGYDNTIISIDANGVVTGLKAGKTRVTLTAKKLDGTNGPTTSCMVTVTPKAPTIEFSLGTGITATISTTEAGAKIYYTINGDTPTESSKEYDDAFTVEAGVTVKAIVVVTTDGENLVSPVAESLANAGSGIVGNTVYLYDLEDHNWTYYSGVDRAVDGGNYNDNYIGKLYSPNPRNVKITYNGVNGISGSNTNVRVSISENENSFVYYKTLEQGSTQGEYPYTVISNPFSVRPSTGSNNNKVYYGFAGWKIKSGGEFIKSYNNNDVLPLDANIVFENLPYNSVNCISAEIVLETTWKQANRTYVSSNPGNNQTYDTSGDYESNFYVINCGYTRTITASQPVTIMMVEPDGSVDYRNSSTFTGNITPNNTGVTKIEFAHWNPGAAVDARGRNFTIGRGIVMDGTRRALYGTNTSSSTVNQILKVESGNFDSFINYNATPSSITKHHAILGCDYDRADENDENLTIRGEMRLMKSSVNRINSTAGKELAIITAKSGTFTSGLTHTSAKESANCFYLWDASSSNTQVGYRKLEIEGGIFWNIGGGMDKSNSTDRITLEMRIKGGTIKGAIFGGGATYDAHGHRLFVCTGGKIGGWIAPGANGIVTSGTSLLDGKSFVYIGGRTRVDSQYADYEKIDNSTGGNVFGAGCGYSSESTRGRVEQGTNVVIADEAYVQRGVYGGGAYGYCEESETANIYITGGHIGSVYDDQFDVYGGVYGGARQNRGGTVNIYMTGGQIDGQKQGGTSGGGVYGGSNVTGTISGNVTMQINGGQVGTSSAPANIHGGGYGQATRVSGNVEVTLGDANQATGGVTVYGDVYGGSALGKVNTNTSNTTVVNLTGGIIHGDAYGGGLGNSTTAADVNGNVTVTLDGTAFALITTTDDKGNTIPTSGRVFGCNNINGSPKGTVLVKVSQTVSRDSEGNIIQKPEKGSGIYELEAVYGGGNLAAYNPTNPEATGQFTYKFNSETYGEVNFTAEEKPVQVLINGCEFTSIEYVYGGGNAAPTPATDVLVLGSYEIGNVFGGGNGKDRYTLDGGNTWNENQGADVGIIDAVAYQQNTANGTYGTGKSKASVLGGTVHNLFGASNTKGNVVTESLAYVDNANLCDLNVGGIYGGGNEAYMDGDSKIELGCIEALEEIYGGARNADVKGDINLTISSGHFDRVFGGNNIGGTIDGSITVTIKETGCNPITIGELYGCGNQAAYTTPAGKEHPTINLISFTSIGNVFGGGFGENAVVKGNPTVNIDVKEGDNRERDWAYNGQTITFSDGSKVTLPVHEKGKIGVIGTVYGGGNAAAVKGNTTVNMTNGIVENTVFGGGNAADVEGSTSVTILDGTIGGNVYGGGNKGDVTGATKVQIGKQPTP